MNERRRLAPFACIAALAGTALGQAPRWFDAPVQFETMQGEFELLDDLDGDGDVDAISFFSPAQNAIKQSFTVWRNDGVGNLSATATTMLAAQAGNWVELADLDGDGRRELLVSTLTTSPLGSGLLIHPGQPGATFGAAQHLPLPGNLLTLHRGDADGNAREDLLAAWFEGNNITTRWLFGQAGGLPMIGPATVLPLTLDYEVLDADSDGLDDVAIAVDSFPNAGTVQIWRTTPAGLSFFASTPLAPAIGSDIQRMDVDGDGDTDILATGIAANFTVATNLGGGNWSSTVQGISGLTAGGLFPGDWDGDGVADLMLRGSSSGSPPSHVLQRLRNVGNGTFAFVDWVLVRDASTGFGPGLADLDQDGRLDWLDAKAAWFGNGRLEPLFGTTELSNMVDWDGDGDLDRSAGNWFVNDGNGTFTARALSWPSLGSNVSAAGASVTADFDGDGLRETTFAAQQFQLPFGLVFLGSFLFQETADYTFVNGGLATPLPGRIDGGVPTDSDLDGDLDIVDTAGIWVNDGTGSFTRLAMSSGGYRPVAQADVDGDGDMDLLATTIGGGTSVAVLHRTGSNTYATTVLFPSTTSTLVNQAAQFADVDDDGDVDVVALDRLITGSYQCRLFTNQGGVFTLATSLAPVGNAALGSPAVGVGDVDGDGLSDVVLFGEQLRVHRRTGPGLTYAAPVVFAARNFQQLVDFDQDGDLDAIGPLLCKNVRFDGPGAGRRRQYGQGSTGAGGRAPVLSVVGPVRGGETPSIRLRNAPGGTFALLIVGSGEVDLPSAVLPGVQSYVFPIDLLLGYTLGGTGLQPAVGGIDIPIAIPNGLAGAGLFLEFVVLDPSLPGAFSNSNGCTFVIGG